MLKRWVWMGMLLAAMVGISGAAGKSDRDRRSFLVGTLIVKMTVEGEKMLTGARDDAGVVLTDRFPEGPLRTICRQHGISRWEPLFPRMRQEKAGGLNRIYRIRLDPSMDVLQAARAFAGLSGWVEYAEPDRRMEVQ